MAHIYDLPNELLQEIARHILEPIDIENFALASKTTRAASDKILLKHRQLTYDFSNFSLRARNPNLSAKWLLKKIVTNPQVALYVKVLTITNARRSRKDRRDRFALSMAAELQAGGIASDGHTLFTERDIEVFKQLVKRATRSYPLSENVNRWFEQTHVIENVEDVDGVAALTLLILLLTNLQSVSL